MPEITAQERSRDGFEGSVPDFLDWIRGRLIYGSVRVSRPVSASPRRARRPLVYRVELVSGGHSADEDLLGRIHLGRGEALSLFSLQFWESSHRGGLYVYEVPTREFHSKEEKVWLQPATDVFETLARARRLDVRGLEGDLLSVETPTGIELAFSEPDRDVNSPAGVMTIQPYCSPVAHLLS